MKTHRLSLLIGTFVLLQFSAMAAGPTEAPEKKDGAAGSPKPGDDAQAYVRRGVENTQQRHFDIAIKEFDKAISLDPQLAVAFQQKGLCETLMGQFSSATNDFTAAIELDPSLVQVYYLRGLSKYCSGQFTAALDDLKDCLSHTNRADSSTNSSAILTALVYRKQNLSDKEFLEWWSKYQGHDWPTPILDYLARLAPIEGPLTQAEGDNGRLTDAKTFLGASAAIAGNTVQAYEFLNWVAVNGDRTHVEYQVAVAELKWLKASGAGSPGPGSSPKQ